jgi:hypothetical protein
VNREKEKEKEKKRKSFDRKICWWIDQAEIIRFLIEILLPSFV